MKAGFWMTPLAIALLVGSVGEAAPRKAEGARGDLNVLLRGGVGDYTGELADLTAAGPTWGLTVNLQPTNVLGWELLYTGSRNQILDDRLADEPTVTRHGAAGLLKIGLPFIQRIKPYVGAGLGATWANVSGEGDYRNDLMQEVPLAAGLEFNSGALSTGIRASYHLLLDEGWADPAVQGTPQGGFVDGELTLGLRF